jgi:hypothetical protein
MLSAFVSSHEYCESLRFGSILIEAQDFAVLIKTWRKLYIMEIVQINCALRCRKLQNVWNYVSVLFFSVAMVCWFMAGVQMESIKTECGDSNLVGVYSLKSCSHFFFRYSQQSYFLLNIVQRIMHMLSIIYACMLSKLRDHAIRKWFGQNVYKSSILLCFWQCCYKVSYFLELICSIKELLQVSK